MNRQRAIELDPAMSQARRSLTRTLERRGEGERAMAQYEVLLEDTPLDS